MAAKFFRQNGYPMFVQLTSNGLDIVFANIKHAMGVACDASCQKKLCKGNKRSGLFEFG
jgi:hypothetical protein